MCGIVGFTSFKNKINNNKEVLFEMTKQLSKRGPDENDYYFTENISLGHRRLIIVDSKNRQTTNE